jgi:hypothetical protein
MLDDSSAIPPMVRPEIVCCSPLLSIRMADPVL